MKDQDDWILKVSYLFRDVSQNLQFLILAGWKSNTKSNLIWYGTCVLSQLNAFLSSFFCLNPTSLVTKLQTSKIYVHIPDNYRNKHTKRPFSIFQKCLKYPSSTWRRTDKCLDDAVFPGWASPLSRKRKWWCQWSRCDQIWYCQKSFKSTR